VDKLRLVLVETEGSVNLGMIARLCENFEVDELVLVRPKADLEEARRYAARAVHRLDEAKIVESLEDALSGSNLAVCTSSVHSTGKAVRIPVEARRAAALAAGAEGTVSLVMGRESVGLTRRELEACDLLATIPTSPRYPSMNLANATAVMLYEFYLARRKPSLARPASRKTRVLFEAYARALGELLVGDPEKRREISVAAKRLAAEAGVHEQELQLLLYLLSRACARLEGCRVEVPPNL